MGYLHARWKSQSPPWDLRQCGVWLAKNSSSLMVDLMDFDDILGGWMNELFFSFGCPPWAFFWKRKPFRWLFQCGFNHWLWKYVDHVGAFQWRHSVPFLFAHRRSRAMKYFSMDLVCPWTVSLLKSENEIVTRIIERPLLLVRFWLDMTFSWLCIWFLTTNSNPRMESQAHLFLLEECKA